MEIKQKLDLKYRVSNYLRRRDTLIITKELFQRGKKVKYEISNGKLNVV